MRGNASIAWCSFIWCDSGIYSGYLEDGVAREMYPGIPIVAEMMTGATDGLYLRNAGIPTYGVSALGQDAADIRAHGRDERVRVVDFDRSVEYWYRLLQAL